MRPSVRHSGIVSKQMDISSTLLKTISASLIASNTTLRHNYLLSHTVNQQLYLVHFQPTLNYSLSRHSNGHIPGGPVLAGTRTSPFCILLELRMMEVVVTTGAIRCAKLQSNHHHQQTNLQLFTGRMPFLSPNQQCRSTEGKLH